MKRTLALLISATALVAVMIGLSTSSASAGVTNSAKPTISGQARIGVTLSASRGSWTYVAPPHQFVQFSFQWLRDGIPIPGATAKTYTPLDRTINPFFPDTDLGSRISVRVTAKWRDAGVRNGPVKSASADSTATTPVLPGLIVSGNPSIAGQAKVGAQAVLSTGTWTPEYGFAVKWMAVDTSGASLLLHECGWDPTIASATLVKYACTHYTIPSEAAGKKLKAEVTGSAPSYLPKTRTATQLGFVQAVGAPN